MADESTPAWNPKTLLVRAAVIWFTMVALGAGGIVLWSASKTTTPPEHYGLVPDFSLTAQSGAAFGSDQLHGKIWVSNFIFTRCKTVCPIFSAKMASLRDRMPSEMDGVRFVSFSVDPTFDTPEILAAYSTQYDANPDRWHFLTGPTDSIREVVTDAMKIMMGDPTEVEAPEDLMHGSHFVLVDQQRSIRGFYQVSNDDTIERLMGDIKTLMAEPN